MDTQLVAYLTKHRQELNLAQLSRLSGMDDSYLKKVVNGTIQMSPAAVKKVSEVLSNIVSDFPGDSQ